MKVNIIDNVKEQFIISINGNLSELKDKMSADILNLELSILYINKIYGQESLGVQEVFSKLSDDIDEILNRHNQNCITSIEVLFSQTKYNKDLLKFLQKL